eukprot:gene30601-37844_t
MDHAVYGIGKNFVNNNPLPESSKVTLLFEICPSLKSVDDESHSWWLDHETKLATLSTPNIDRVLKLSMARWRNESENKDRRGVDEHKQNNGRVDNQHHTPPRDRSGYVSQPQFSGRDAGHRYPPAPPPPPSAQQQQYTPQYSSQFTPVQDVQQNGSEVSVTLDKLKEECKQLKAEKENLQISINVKEKQLQDHALHSE